MATFVILARKNWGDSCLPLTQVSGGEDRAVDIAQSIYRKGGMNRALVVNADFKVVFKIDRRCKCLNAQYTLDGRLICDDCRRAIPQDMIKVEEYQ